MMTLVEALVHVRITLLQLWLGLLLFHSGWSQYIHAQHHSPPEVVIPLRVTGTGIVTRSPDWLSYSLYFGGQSHVVHMKTNKFLVSRDLSVFTYTDQGTLLEDQPFIQNDCYYHGYVEGDPESLVALTTCLGGLQGILQINDILYEIKPKNLSGTFEHLIYKMDSEERELLSVRCAVTEEEIERQLKIQARAVSTLKQSGYEGWWIQTRIVELGVVVDHKRFLYLERNMSKLQDEIIIIINEMNSYFSFVGIDVILVGLEVWTERNPINVEDNDIQSVLIDFCTWKRGDFSTRISHDIAHIYVNHSYSGMLGQANLGSACNFDSNCAISSFLNDEVPYLAYIATHEVGHVLGMHHDDDELCICGQGHRHCIMNSGNVFSTQFSNCSYAQLWNTQRNCLRNSPVRKAIFPWVQCGNGVVEDGEQCDCGSLKSCTNDSCCLLGCTLKPGAACASGLCCKDCQVLPPRTLCREQDGECDLPEWCNGTSPECPEDVYVQDGLPCLGIGYCYKKICNNHHEQCKKIFGKDATSANQSCYKEMNTRGDRFGNCGMTSDGYLQCNITDVLCGRVQCENMPHIPLLKEHSTVHQIHFNEVTCWGTDYHWGMTIPDIGEVKDGTACGLEQLCIHRKCVNISSLKGTCSTNDCNMRGICNNKQHCHCHFGWDPPNCLKKGSGGSVDSGPSPLEDVDVLKRGQKRIYTGLIFLGPFCFLLFSLFIFFCKRDKLLPKKEEPEAEPLPVKEEPKVQTSSKKEPMKEPKVLEKEENFTNPEDEYKP